MTTPGPNPEARWRLLTPAGVPGAVASLALEGDVDRALGLLGLPALRVGEVRVVDLAGQDRGVAARVARDRLRLMPHGGVAVVRAVTEALTRAGIAEAVLGSFAACAPRTLDEIEDRLAETLALAASPLAIDLLLDQPRRWRESVASAGPGAFDAPPTPARAAREAVLRRLVHPPLVVALGPPNIGKSTLVNALAGRGVAVVADEPGTTRDHVGVRLDLAGLVVRYADTPGVRATPDELEREAIAGALALVSEADLVLRLGDATQPPPEGDWVRAMAPGAIQVAASLRRDLGVPAWPADARICAPRGEGLGELVSLLRDALLPRELLTDPAPWRFWT